MPFIDKSTLTCPATNSFPVRKWLDENRDPVSGVGGDFKNFQIFDIWINFPAHRAWIMVDKTVDAGYWVPFGNFGNGILTITGNTGGPVPGDINSNINILGSGTLVFAGNLGTNTINVTGGGGTKFTKITASGNWTKDANAKYIKICGWAGGAGGGSGRRGAAGTNRGGGGGGKGGGFFYFEGPADFFGAMESVTIGAGGTGGAAVLLDDTNGNNGARGTDTIFGNMTTNLAFSSPGNLFGSGGTAAGGAGGNADPTAINYFTFGSVVGVDAGDGGVGVGQDGADLNTQNNFGNAQGDSIVNSSGGGGGGISNVDAAANGGRGGNVVMANAAASVILAGGTAGTVGVGQTGGNGGDLSSVTSGGLFFAGTGGGGGASNLTGASGPGGNGGIPGGGGGGGAASVNGFDSGKGGNGARGEVWVIEFLG